jgi:DNA-binding HxlR family transcriptional regulator
LDGGPAAQAGDPAIPGVPPPKRHPYDQWSPDARALDLVGDKWTLLIIRDLIAGPRRFVELQRVLPGISTEQLRSRLNRMVADGLLTRQRYREVPPRVDYELTDRSRELVPVIGELARWGYAWAWGQPREQEAIDIGAIFRAAPGLCVAPPGVEGTVELRVDGRSYSMRVGAGPATLSEEEPQSADATIAGTEDEWVLALGPDGSRSALTVSGDERLADVVLDAIRPTTARTAVHAA